MLLCHLFLFLSLSTAGATLQQAPIVSDPVADFLLHPPTFDDNGPPDRIDFLYRIRVDFQGTGQPDVLLTTEYASEGHGVYSWLVYKPIDGGYLRPHHVVGFPVDFVTVLPVSGCPGMAMAVVLHGDSPTECTVNSVWLRADDTEADGSFQNTGTAEEIAAFIQKCDENHARYVEKIDTSNMPQRKASESVDESQSGQAKKSEAPETPLATEP